MRPEGGAQQRDVHDRGLARALAVEQRTHDAAGDRHGTDGVAEGGAGRPRNGVVIGVLHAERDAGATPVGERIVGAAVGVGSALTVAGTPYVDDLGVVGSEVLDVDLELGPHARQLVRQEDVAGRRQSVEDVEAVLGVEVERQALLPAVRVLEQHVDLGAHDGEPARCQATHRVASLDVLDLDHLGSPVGEERRCSRHERVLGHFEDADSLHDCGHGSSQRRLWSSAAA